MPFEARKGLGARAGLVAALAGAALLVSPPARADLVADWNVAAASAGGVHYQLAMLHVAIHDTVAAAKGTYPAFAVNVAKPAVPVSLDAAITEAAYRVLVGLSAKAGGPAGPGLAAIQALHANSLGAIPDGAAKTAGVALGDAVAAALLAERQADGWPYLPVGGSCVGVPAPCPAPADPVDGSAAGAYRRTPPTTRALAQPWLGSVRPFVVKSASQFRADGPPALASARYAEDYLEVLRTGGAASSERTDEQTKVAIFHTYPPFRFWASLARNAAADHGLTVEQNARLQALVWVANFDAMVTCWESKYHFYAWRPYTAIANPIHDDGNPATTPDPTWSEAVQSAPPHPEYPSGHSCAAGSIVEPLAQYFATKKLGLRGTGATVPNSAANPTERAWATTTRLLHEIGDARVWAGIHFRFATEDGIALGRQVAKYVAKNGFGLNGSDRGEDLE